MNYKKTHSFEKRFNECIMMKNKYPDKLPIVCERSYNCSTEIPEIDKKKYLVPMNMTLGDFLTIIRTRLKLSPDKAIFLLIDNNIPSGSSHLSDVYSEYKDSDGFLYITYTGENVFG